MGPQEKSVSRNSVRVLLGWDLCQGVKDGWDPEKHVGEGLVRRAERETTKVKEQGTRGLNLESEGYAEM